MIYELAGLIGIDPGPYSLRQLVWMWEAKRDENWTVMSVAVSWLINTRPRQDKRKRKIVKPEHINPYSRHRRRRKRGSRLRGDSAEKKLDAASAEAK